MMIPIVFMLRVVSGKVEVDPEAMLCSLRDLLRKILRFQSIVNLPQQHHIIPNGIVAEKRFEWYLLVKE